MTSETASRIQQHIPEIIDLWEAEVRTQISSSKEQSAPIIHNFIGEYLAALASALSNNQGVSPAATAEQATNRVRLSRLHGKGRALETAYLINEVIAEFHLLRATIFKFLERDGYTIPQIDREIMINAIEQSVNDAATQFSKTVREIQERFMLTLVHDLRGPVSIATTSASLISKNARDETFVRQMAEIIDRNMQQADSLIRDLLDAGKLQAGGTIPLHFASCDLVALTRELVREYKPKAGNRILLKTSSNRISGYWSANSLKRVLANLLDNALKYSERDSNVIIRLDRSDGTTSITMHSVGKPIPPDERARLFNEFQRGPSSKGILGWGLGLAFVRGAVEAHHGRVKVESSQSGETDFVVELPTDFRTASSATLA